MQGSIVKRNFFKFSLQAIPSDSSITILEAIIHNNIEYSPQVTIYYPYDNIWYYIVPDSDSTSIKIVPASPSAELVKKYTLWSYKPF